MPSDVARQSVHHLSSNVVRVGVQRSNDMMLGSIDSGTPASAADSDHRSASRYRCQARHEFTAPRRATSDKTFVVVSHQFVEIVAADLRTKSRPMGYRTLFITLVACSYIDPCADFFWGGSSRDNQNFRLISGWPDIFPADFRLEEFPADFG